MGSEPFFGNAQDMSLVSAVVHCGTPVADARNPVAVQTAIKEVQQLIPGYTYAEFCAKVAAAGCAGYMVSFIGRRSVDYACTAETHVERFPL